MDSARIASVIIRVLAAAVIVDQGATFLVQAAAIGAALGPVQGGWLMLLPLAAIGLAVLVFRQSRALGTWISRDA